jgi:hypothetical protein
MENVDFNKIKDKIRKLLAVANGKANENESLIAARQANKLMEKYNLSMADVIVKDLEKDANVINEFVNEWRYAKQFPKYYSFLVTAVAKLYDCEVRYERDGKKGIGIKIFGFHADVEIAKWTIVFLHSTGSILSEEYWDSIKDIPNYHNKGQFARKEFMNGYSARMSDRLAEMKEQRQAVVTSSGTSLMVVKKDAIARVYGDFSYTESSTSYTNHSAAGSRAANSVEINTPIEQKANTYIS